MFQAAEWEPIDSVIQRACWTWLGHVARMHIPALPKVALWGWPKSAQPGSRRSTQGTWLKSLLAKTSISPRDWFRISVSRGGQWQAAGRRFFPKRRISKEQATRLRAWPSFQCSRCSGVFGSAGGLHRHVLAGISCWRLGR